MITWRTTSRRCAKRARDVVTFRGDQRHGYHNPGKVTAVAYSVIAFAPISA